MENNENLTAKVSGWLRQYGLCPGEHGENGWTEVYYDGVLFEYDVMVIKCVLMSVRRYLMVIWRIGRRLHLS